MKLTFRTLIIESALFFENYILAVLFGLSIFHLLGFFIDKFDLLLRVFSIHSLLNASYKIQLIASLFIMKFFLIVLYSFCLLGLIMHKPVIHKPHRYREVFVPLMGTFFYLFYQLIEYVPFQLNFYIVPPDTLSFFIVTGTLLNILGFGISIAAVFNLKHAFGIFVETRKMTTAGLYKIVRHPIYLGYCVSAIGICFILPKTVYIVLSLVIISFNLYRAVLEESKLLSAYPEYKIYADSTPFILPFKIRGKHAHSN